MTSLYSDVSSDKFYIVFDNMIFYTDGSMEVDNATYGTDTVRENCFVIKSSTSPVLRPSIMQLLAHTIKFYYILEIFNQTCFATHLTKKNPYLSIRNK